MKEPGGSTTCLNNLRNDPFESGGFVVKYPTDSFRIELDLIF
jgi:hypothetical protein